MKALSLKVLELELSICRLPPDAPLPDIPPASFWSVTRTPDELSIVTTTADAPRLGKCVHGWRCLEIQGPLAFDEVGVIESIAKPLADAGVGIFVISTFDTDYLLVKSTQLDQTCEVLRSAGHKVLSAAD